MEDKFSRLVPPFKGTRPDLTYDILHKVFTQCDLYTKRKLAILTNKAVFGHLCTPRELADFREIETSEYDEKLFFRAVVTKDNDVFLRQLSKMYKGTLEHGLQLAVRYGNRRATWVLLALRRFSKGIQYDAVEDSPEFVVSAMRQQDPNELEDIIKLSEFSAEYKAFCFFTHLLKNDNARYYQHLLGLNQDVLAFGLQLAGKYGYNQGAMVLLACGHLHANMPPELQKIIAAEEKRRSPTELLHLAEIRSSQKNEGDFFRSIIARDTEMDYKPLQSLSGAARMFGLRLALQYGSSWDAWLLVAWGELDFTKCKELLNEAKSRMTPTEVADIARIHKSNGMDKKFFRKIITNNFFGEEEMEEHILDNDIALDFGIQLAVRRGNIEGGFTLLRTGSWHRQGRSFVMANDAAKQSPEYMLHWEAIQRTSLMHPHALARYSYETDDSDGEVRYNSDYNSDDGDYYL